MYADPNYFDDENENPGCGGAILWVLFVIFLFWTLS